MSSISEFYSDKTVLITGATGFMGKVLLERMLSTLPNIKRIYLFLRPKNGLSVEKRLEELLSHAVFSVNHIATSQISKVYAINADMCKEDFNLSDEDKQQLLNEVSIVIHMAANVNFDLPLKDALLQNSLATKNLLELCLHIRNLVSVVYVSTTFCNGDIDNCEEKVYNLKDMDPYKLLDILSHGNRLNEIQNRLIKPYSNTYTFTKRLAEIIANDFGAKLPLCILRPSIVFPAWKKPVPGWVDSMKGAMGLFVASLSGITRVQYMNPEARADIIPVDCAVNAVIVASWYRAMQRDIDTPVYNVTTVNTAKCKWRNILNISRSTALEHPFRQLYWYPKFCPTTNYLRYVVWFILYHFIPGYIYDSLLIIFGRKPYFVDIYRRTMHKQKMVAYFGLREFRFETRATEELFLELNSKDQIQFYGIREFKPDTDYLKQFYLGIRKYCLKDDGNSNGRHIWLNMFFMLDLILQTASWCTIAWVLWYFIRETIF